MAFFVLTGEREALRPPPPETVLQQCGDLTVPFLACTGPERYGTV